MKRTRTILLGVLALGCWALTFHSFGLSPLASILLAVLVVAVGAAAGVAYWLRFKDAP